MSTASISRQARARLLRHATAANLPPAATLRRLLVMRVRDNDNLVLPRGTGAYSVFFGHADIAETLFRLRRTGIRVSTHAETAIINPQARHHLHRAARIPNLFDLSRVPLRDPVATREYDPDDAGPRTTLSVSEQAGAELNRYAYQYGAGAGHVLRVMLTLHVLSGEATVILPRGVGSHIITYHDSLRVPVLPAIRAKGWRVSTVADSVIRASATAGRLAYWFGLDGDARGDILRGVWRDHHDPEETVHELTDEEMLAAT